MTGSTSRFKSFLDHNLIEDRSVFVKARNNLANGQALAAKNGKTIKSFLRLAAGLWKEKTVGRVSRTEAMRQIRKVAEQHPLGMGMTLAHLMDLCNDDVESQLQQWVEQLVGSKPTGKSPLAHLRKRHWENVVSRRIDSLIRVRVALLQMVKLRQRGDCFVEKLYCKERKRQMYGVYAMAPEQFSIEICPGMGFMWYGDYECFDGHKKTTNGNYLVDLVNARVFDLSSSYGHDGLSFCGWIMREKECNEIRDSFGRYQVNVWSASGKDVFTLHRFVHHVAHHHGASIFGDEALQDAGFDLGDRIYEHILGYRPLNEDHIHIIRRTIHASRRLSKQSDIDHGVGRSYQWTNGILHCWACSHRINTCAVYVRVLENDWCYLLQKREYRGGVEVTDCSNEDDKVEEEPNSNTGLFDGLTSFDPKLHDGGSGENENGEESFHLWAESLVGKAVRVLWGSDNAGDDNDIGWYDGAVVGYTRDAEDDLGFTISFEDGVTEQMKLDTNSIELAEVESLEDIANAMCENELPYNDENNGATHNTPMVPSRPTKRSRVEHGASFGCNGENLFNAFRRETG